MYDFTGFLQYDVKPTLFTFHELRVATKDFHSSMKLGEGTFGIVYKVCIPKFLNLLNMTK